MRIVVYEDHTSLAGTWHADLCDGGDDRVVPIAFADQVNDVVRDLFDRAPVQPMVLGRLQVTRRPGVKAVRLGFKSILLPRFKLQIRNNPN